MLKKERQELIYQTIKMKKYCTVSFLAKKLFVAPITVRRDLCEMEKAGLVLRCYGGASIPDYENRDIPFELRNKSNFTAKEALAKKAAELVSVGDVLFLDASSTVSHIIDHLDNKQHLTIITNSTLIAEKATERGITCYLSGGKTVDNSYALTGEVAIKTISDFYANICFFSSQAIDQNGVITDYSEMETALRRAMIKNSTRQYFIFDSSKFSKRQTFKLCSTDDISGVITDLENSPF